MDELAAFHAEEMTKKMMDSNIIKVSRCKPHEREVVVEKVHGSALPFMFPGAATNANSLDVTYNFESLDDLQMNFKPETLVRFWKSRDITLITPWAVTITREVGPKNRISNNC